MISKKLLPHSVTIKKPLGMDADRNQTYEEIEVSGVRVSTTYARSKNSQGFTSADSMVLISDNKNTSPADFVPAEGMKVIFQEGEFTINSVKPCFADSSELHHYISGLN